MDAITELFHKIRQTKDSKQLNHRLEALAYNSVESLPPPEKWISNITTLEEAEQIAQQYRTCEQQTIDITNTLAQEFPQMKAVHRTDSNWGDILIGSLQKGVAVRLKNIPLNQIPYDRTMNIRAPFIEAALRKLGLKQAFQRLPPLLIGMNETNGKIHLFDGNTRSNVAEHYKVNQLPAYVIPHTALPEAYANILK
jgi:hypothetical protein